MTITSTGLAAVVLGAGTLILVPSTADAAPPTTTRTIEVRAEYTEPMPQFDGVECRGLDGSAPWCQGVMPGRVTFTGTIAGEAHAESAGPTTTGHTYEYSVTLERAVVKGCGVGGLILDTFDGDFDFTDTRPSDSSTGASDKWRIRPGSGTATLAGISGHGENLWRAYWTESGDRWARGLYTGTITCQVPKTPAAPPHTETRTVNVRSEVRAPISAPAGAACRGVATADPWCQGRFFTEVTLTGTMSGTGKARDGGPAQDHHAEGLVAFEQLKIDGCGEGALTFDFVTDFDFAGTRLTDLSTGAHDTWTARKGTGTSGLAGVVGGDLVYDWRAYWADGAQWMRGAMTGTITCEIPVNESHAKSRVVTAPPAAAPADPVTGATLAPGGAPDGAPDVAVLRATFVPISRLPRTGGAATAALAGVALLGAGFVVRRVSRA